MQEYFKIYHYDKGITLHGSRCDKRTPSVGPEKKDSDKKDTDANKDPDKSEKTSKDQTSEAADSAEGGEAGSR